MNPIACRKNCFKENITLTDMMKSKKDEDFCEVKEVNCWRKFVNVILPLEEESGKPVNVIQPPLGEDSTLLVALSVVLVAVILASIGIIAFIWHSLVMQTWFSTIIGRNCI